MKRHSYEIWFDDICIIERGFVPDEAIILAQAKMIKKGMNYFPTKVYLINENGQREMVEF